MVETHSTRVRSLVAAVVLTAAMLVFAGCSSTPSGSDENTIGANDPTVAPRSTELPGRAEAPPPTETTRGVTQSPTSIPDTVEKVGSGSQIGSQVENTPVPAMTDNEPESKPEVPATAPPANVAPVATETPAQVAPVATEPPLINTPVPVVSGAPDFALPSVQGPEYTLSQFRDDKAVAVVFYRGYW